MPEAHRVQAEHGGFSENVGMIVTTRKTFKVTTSQNTPRTENISLMKTFLKHQRGI